ncbi:MAG TPA: MarR family transcriptional regulator [Candidatus Acidoferrum sp.]|nr:MarR family transcriptional regulator [Candidatus Acidoferrum sp.]
MPPVKHKKNKRKNLAAPKASFAPPSTPPVTPAIASSAAAQVDSSPISQALSSPDLPPSLAAMDVADQLHSAAIHLLRRLRVRDRETSVGPAQLSALSVLVFGGPKSLGELADAEQVRPPTMSRIVAGLQRSGLVRRHATEDGRRVRLEATPKGVSLMWEARKRRVESLAKAVAGLPENEKQQLREALTLLRQVLRNL